MSSPVSAWMTVISRSWTRSRTGAVPGPADADVVEASGSAEGDAAVVDFVGADAVVGSVRGFGAWCGFGPGLIGRGWGAPVQ